MFLRFTRISAMDVPGHIVYGRDIHSCVRVKFASSAERASPTRDARPFWWVQ